MAEKSIQTRKQFYEKEIESLNQTENVLRDSLINHWKLYGSKYPSTY